MTSILFKYMAAFLLLAVALPAPLRAETFYVHKQTYRVDKFSAQYCTCYSVSKAQVLSGNAFSQVVRSYSSYADAAIYRNMLTEGAGICGGCSAPISYNSSPTCTTIFGIPGSC